MPVAIRLDRDGKLVGSPRKSKTHRVFIAAADARADGYPITAEGLRILRDDPEQRAAFVNAATSFRGFLKHWRFLSGETGEMLALGDELWPSQESYVRAVEEHAWVWCLKARQLGQTTLAIAYDAYCVRFRDVNGRAHCFSATEQAAKELLEHIDFGLEQLPPAMRVPLDVTTRSIRLDFGGGERALVRSYPSTRAASRGSTCTHLHADELAATIDSRKVFQSILPSVAPGGSFHVVGTEAQGPESFTANMYRQCAAGEGKHFAFFCDALARPDRDEAWLEGTRKALPAEDLSREYPMSAEEALSAAGERKFRSTDIDIAMSQPLGIFPTQAAYEAKYARMFEKKGKRRKYSAGIDIGLRQDATVAIVLDVTEEIWEVVGYHYMPKPEVGDVINMLNQLHRAWPGAHLSIEVNGPGWAIYESCSISDSKKHEWTTTSMSKNRAVGEVQVLLEQFQLSFDGKACPQLEQELHGYRTPDVSIRQDTVAALWVAVGNAHHAHNPTGGRILPWKSYNIDI